MLSIIVAKSKNNVIGKDNKLIWHIPEDLKRFKNLTTGHTIIMGRKTLDSLPCGKPLPDRTNIVLSRDPGFARDGVRVCNNSGELALLLRDISGDVYVIGGGEVYRELLPFCDTAYITVVDADADADTFLPKLDYSDGWQLADQSPDHEENGLIYRFLTFERHI